MTVPSTLLGHRHRTQQPSTQRGSCVHNTCGGMSGKQSISPRQRKPSVLALYSYVESESIHIHDEKIGADEEMSDGEIGGLFPRRLQQVGKGTDPKASTSSVLSVIEDLLP